MKNGKILFLGKYGWSQPVGQYSDHGALNEKEVDEAWVLWDDYWASHFEE